MLIPSTKLESALDKTWGKKDDMDYSELPDAVCPGEQDTGGQTCYDMVKLGFNLARKAGSRNVYCGWAEKTNEVVYIIADTEAKAVAKVLGW